MPDAAARAGDGLQGLASAADALAEQVARFEYSRGLAEDRERSALLRLHHTDPTDVARIASLRAEAREASVTARRAVADITEASARWNSHCRGAVEVLQGAAGELRRVTAPVVGPVQSPGAATSVDAVAPGTGWVELGWSWGASPALSLYNERQRYMILHLQGRTTAAPTTQRALQQDVRRRGHWRAPRRVGPDSPLAGQHRPPVAVSPVYGQVRETRVSAWPAPATRTTDVAQRVPVPREAWSRTTRVLGPVGGVATAGMAGVAEYQAVSQREDLTGRQRAMNVGAVTLLEGGGTAAGGGLGAKGGAAAGAALGTMIAPGIGTAIGAGIGAVVGGVGGGWVGNTVGSAATEGARRRNPGNLFGDR